jgi:phytol kinase
MVVLYGNMIAELPFVVLVTGTVAAGLWVSNIAYDLGVPHYISRKIGHGAGGLAFLASFVLSSAWWPIIISAIFGILLLTTHLVKPDVFRGVGGAGRSNKILAEVWFAWVAVPVFAICWLWLNKPAVAVSSMLFMAWGDGITGLIRWKVYRKPVKGLWGSLAMFCTCLVISWVFIRPIWIGIVASVMATVTERVFGDYGVLKWGDDNWAIPVVSMGIMLGLMALTGIL